MEITLENYEKIFGDLNVKMQSFEGMQEDDIKKVVFKLKEQINDVHEGGRQLKADNDVLKIGVVGQVKAGKSSFLNSLFFDGENVLPKASTPMTAGLTVLQYGEENSFSVEYYSTKEWQIFLDRAKSYDDVVADMGGDATGLGASCIPDEWKAAKELVSKCGSIAKSKIKDVAQKEINSFVDVASLQNVLEKYVGANGDFTSITKCLVITLHDERLKGVQIVDTPGVNDPVLSREQRTREFLRGCHGVFFLSYSGGFFNTTDVSFLTNRIGDQGIGTVVVIASKFDSVLQDAGNKFRDDLFTAIDDCWKKLEKQLDYNVSSSNYKGAVPKFSCSSGIGYSISKKPSSRWDSMESTVVSQMKKFYPSSFASEEDVVETFYNLSNIDVIYKEYLENVFLNNKVDIINKKISAYFANASEKLKKEFKNEIDDFSVRITGLENGDLDNIKEQRSVTETIIKEIKSDINTVASRAESIADLAVKECLNEFQFRWSGRTPTTIERRYFQREGTVFGASRNFECQYERVDLCQLIEEVNKSLNSSLDRLCENWNSKTSKLRGLIAESVNTVITENEIKDKKGYLDSKMLRNMLDEVLDSMLSENTLDTHSIREEFHSKLTNNLNGTDELEYTKTCCKENEAIELVRKAADKCKREISTTVNNSISAVHQDIEEALMEARKRSIAVFKDKKDEFINSVTQKMNEVLLQLEKDLKNKEEKLNILKSVHNELIKIESEL